MFISNCSLCSSFSGDSKCDVTFSEVVHVCFSEDGAVSVPYITLCFSEDGAVSVTYITLCFSEDGAGDD
jgi:hypothetical protein